MSPTVQALSSLHAPVLLAKTQAPAAQLSVVHALLSLHAKGAPTQVLFEQTSPVVQPLPSSHAALLLTREQAPAVHVSSVQGLPSPQSVSLVQVA